MDWLIYVGMALMVFTAISTIRYNKLRCRWYGIIGVGGSFLVMFGVMVLFMLVGGLIQDPSSVTFGNTFLYWIILAAAIFYVVKLMLTRCYTVKERVMLPLAAVMICFGFIVRLVLGVLTHAPISDGSTSKHGFPSVLYDDQENEYRLQSDSGDHADYYCSKTGATVQFWEADFRDAGLPAGWRYGN